MSERTGGRQDAMQPSPYLEIDRSTWSALSGQSPSPLSEREIEQIRGLGDELSLTETQEVYVPLSRMLNVHATAMSDLKHRLGQFLPVGTRNNVPYVIGIAGSVAVGKSTVARLLQALLSRWEGTPRVQLITTDGFLYPNAELERRNILSRKGFPESYDRRALLKFMASVKGGAAIVEAPVYSHLVYDIVPGKKTVVRHPDILIVEGLNVLQPAIGASTTVSDFFDFGIYVDARTSDIERWYRERFLKLKHGAFTHPTSYFHRFANISDAEATEYATDVWHRINEPNLYENILGTRSRADLVLKKAADHSVQRVLVRKL